MSKLDVNLDSVFCLYFFLKPQNVSKKILRVDLDLDTNVSCPNVNKYAQFIPFENFPEKKNLEKS